MLRSKTFLKPNKQGGFNKVVKEHYLRDDIPCGVVDCQPCKSIPNSKSIIQGLDILIPDTNIILHYLDVLERSEFNDIIILQTVLEETRNRNVGIHGRLRSLISSQSKRIHVFSNELHKDTYLEAFNSSDSSTKDNDRNDKSIRKAASWYKNHLSNKYRIILLTNDRENERLATMEGTMAFNLMIYCRELHPSNLDLVDMVSRNANQDMQIEEIDKKDCEKQSSEFIYPEDHLSDQEMETIASGIKSGTLFKGIFQASPYNPHEGTVNSENSNIGTIFLHDRLSVNRAIHGDMVIVKLLPKSEWHKQETIQHDLMEDDSIQNNETILPSTKQLNSTIEMEKDLKPSGKVIFIQKRKEKNYCGSIDRKSVKINPSIRSQHVLFVPMNRRIPRIRIFTSQLDALLDQRIMIHIDDWQRNSNYPSGHLVKILGRAGEKSTETEAILLEHDISYLEFTPQVLSCLPSVTDESNYCPEDWEYEGRMDLRHLNVCSIDPPGCTDIDDALHATKLDNGNWQIGVHIADVTHFVKAKSALDIEASQRATTVYLVDRRIDMLPPLLGTNLCSLKCNVERFAFSCIWEMTPNAEIKSTQFSKSIIRSRASFTYDQAQARLDSPEKKRENNLCSDGNVENDNKDKDDDDALTSSLRALLSLSKKLKQRRIESGALTLASPEVRFNLDQDTQNPVDVELKESKEANSLVEEFMLLANISVAMELYKSFPETAILRRHPPPPEENFEALISALGKRGYDLRVKTSKELSDSLDQIIDPNDSFFNRLVRIMATRCMYQAVYFASGEYSHEQFKHYGLATPIYTHFTSPIRRYSDVLVHRLLHASIDSSRLGAATCWSKDQLVDICHNMNYRHRMAQQAQRSSIELFSHLFFREKKSIQENGYIIKILPDSIVALVPKYGIEGLIKIIHKEEINKLEYDINQLAFKDKESNKIILELFQKVVIELYIEQENNDKENGFKQKMSYRLVSPVIQRIINDKSDDFGNIGEKRKNS